MIYKIADRHNIYHRNGPFVYQFNCLSVKTRKSRNLKLSPETTLITNLPNCRGVLLLVISDENHSIISNNLLDLIPIFATV